MRLRRIGTLSQRRRNDSAGADEGLATTMVRAMSAPTTTATGRPRLLFVSADPVGDEMAGAGIRCFELARVLSHHATVTVAHSGARDGHRDDIELLAYRPHAPDRLRQLIAAADIVVAQPQWPLVSRWLRAAPARVVYDLYDPETFETLELMATERPLVRRVFGDLALDRLHDALRGGDHFMCASETQRDLWLGTMLGLRMIEPAGYDADPSLRSVIDLVPFGLPNEPPVAIAGAGPRDVVPGVDADSELVLWNGGLWNWLDPVTAIRAVAIVAEHRPRVRLVFMGAANRAAASEATAAARAAARELGLLDSVVHFHDRWVPYAERAAWLLQADCAISTHGDHLETHFAFRTRLLDCFWSRLPVVCTSGDDLAERVHRDDLGAVAAAGDVEGVASSIERVLGRGREAYAERLGAVAQEYAWPRAAQTLVGWVRESPARTSDAAPSGMVRPTLAHRLRSAGYLAGGRLVLERRYPKQ